MYVDYQPQEPSKEYQARGMTLISIAASSSGPSVDRQGDLIISGLQVAYGGFSSVLGYTSTAKPQDLNARDVYLLGMTEAGLQLARASVGHLTDFSHYSFWDPTKLEFDQNPPKLDEKDIQKIYLPGTFSSGSIFYSPYFNTFLMIYFNKYVDSTFRIRFLDLNTPVGDDPIWPRQGKGGKGIAPEDVEALVKYAWSPEQELYKSPPAKGGFNYAGMAHPEYFNRQYFAPSLYPKGTSAGERRNLWYGSSLVSEKKAGGDGRHLLLSWTAQVRGGFGSGIYQVQLAKVEFGTVPDNPQGAFPSATFPSSTPTLSLAPSVQGPSVTPAAPSSPHPLPSRPSSSALTSAGSAGRTAQQRWKLGLSALFEGCGALVGVLVLLIDWVLNYEVW